MIYFFLTNKFRVVYYYFIKIIENYNFVKKIQKNGIFLHQLLYKYIYSIVIQANCITIFINKLYLYEIIFFFKNNLYFCCNQLLDFTIVDCLELSIWHFYRYEFIYYLLSIYYNIRIFVKGFLMLVDYLITISNIYSSSDWLEREVWDMFGIFFYNHTNLRRILTDYGFIGHPLRKDFPLSGYTELRYDDVFKVVVIEPIELLQEFRYFSLETPWLNA